MTSGDADSFVANLVGPSLTLSNIPWPSHLDQSSLLLGLLSLPPRVLVCHRMQAVRDRLGWTSDYTGAIALLLVSPS